MKKVLLFALVSMFSALVPALASPPPPANVNFVSERGVPFDLVLDGRLMTRGGARQVRVAQLMPGQHWADFTVPAGYGRVVRFRSQVWLQPGLETSYVLIARPGRPLGLQQVGAVALYGPAPGGYNGYNNGPGYGGPYNRPQPYDQSGYGNAAPAYPNNGYPNANPNGGYNAPNGSYSNDNGYGNNPNGPADGSYGNRPSSPGNGGYNNQPNNGGYGTNPNNNGGRYPGSAASSYRALAPTDVNALVQTMQQRITEVSKLNAAKDGLNQRALRADDLSRLLRGLSSEACRIDLAKFAYSHVSDPENFGRVYDAFETEAGAQAVEQAVHEGEQR